MGDILSKNLMGWHLLENIAPFETLTDLAPSSYLHHFPPTFAARAHLVACKIHLFSRIHLASHIQINLHLPYTAKNTSSASQIHLYFVIHLHRQTRFQIHSMMNNVTALCHVATRHRDLLGMYVHNNHAPINPLFFVFTNHNLCSAW